MYASVFSRPALWEFIDSDGICDFAKSCCKDESEVCTCRDAAQVDESGSCDCCRGGDVPKCAPVDQFCKRDHYRDGQKIIGAFDALTNDPHQFITFAGSTALSFKWNTGEARGETLTSAHSGSAADSLDGGDVYDPGREDDDRVGRGQNAEDQPPLVG